MDITHYLQNPLWGGVKWDIALGKRMDDPKYLEAFGYKVYSQNDEDGILHEIFQRIGTENKSFVEFGVDIGIESNCHSLLLQGWKGLWIEGRETAYSQILRRFVPAIRQEKLKVLNQYVTRENINEILKKYANPQLDLLSIDVDGNDWHIWNAVTAVMPRVVVIEYNGKFTPEIDWKMAYNKEHIWDRSDRCGASLKALENLGRKKGYQLVGTNIVGINAFFVRSDLAKNLFAMPATAENLYNPARMNILRHCNGHPGLNYVGNDMEGMEGIFEYYPDWNSLSSYGFWKVEVKEKYRRDLLSQKEAQLFIRFLPETLKIIRFHYSTGISMELLNNNQIHVKISIGGKIESQFVLTEKNGVLDIEVKREWFDKDIIPVKIVTDSLWIPDTLIHNNDTRKQGIAIEGVEYLE